MLSFKNTLRSISALIVLSLALAIPFTSAMAFDEGPNYPASGTNLPGIGTEPWQNPGNITTPGDPYASVTLYQGHIYSNYLLASQYGFAIPADASITGIELRINRMSDSHNPNVLDNAVRLVKGGLVIGENKAIPDQWATTFVTAIYGGPTDLWGTTWTPAEINAGNFGAVLAVYRDNNGNNARDALVDSMQVTVYYEYNTETAVVCGDGSPIIYGESVTCVATVTRQASNLTPTGTVAWTTDGSGTFDPNPCTLSGANGVSTCSAVYTPSAVGTGTHLVTATYSGDDYFTSSNATTTVSVLLRPITVTADPQTKVYGDPDPALTYQVTQGSLVFNDTFTGTLTRDPGELVGSYAILQGSLALPNSYDLTYVGNFLTITRADPTCTVLGYNVPYDGYEHLATGSCVGVFGEPLEGLDLNSTAHTNAGSYTDTWTFTDVSGNYNDDSGSVTDTISKVDATCDVTAYDVTYDGNPHTAEGSCTGVNSEPLSGLDLSGTTHTDVGSYTDPWVFTDVTGNYNDQSGTVDDHIGRAEATCEVTAYDVPYDGNPHTAEGACTGVNGEPLSGLDLSGTTHTNAGVYLADPWVYVDESGNYNDQDGTVDDHISKADATCDVNGYLVEYDREVHTASGACTGVLGEPLDGLDLTGTEHSEVGVYANDPWVFADETGNYNNTSGSVSDEITLRAVTIEADPQSKMIGQPDPELTYQITAGSLLEGDAFSGTLERDPGEAPGTYAILLGSLSLPDYYALTYVGANFTIASVRLMLPIVIR